MRDSHTKTHIHVIKTSSYFNTTRQHSCLRHAWGASKHTEDIQRQVKVFQRPTGEWQSSQCERELVSQNLLHLPNVFESPVNSPDTASWNSSSLRALRGEDPLTTDCSSSWCSVARVCSASERILFFSTSCSNFRLRTWAHHTQTHTHKKEETNHSQKQKHQHDCFTINDWKSIRFKGCKHFMLSLIANRPSDSLYTHTACWLTDPPFSTMLSLSGPQRGTEMELRGTRHVYL